VIRRLRVGPYAIEVATSLPDVQRSVAALYADHPDLTADDFVDFSVSVRRRSFGRWWKPQVVFGFEGADPFNPLPGDQGFPLLEWGLNWCVYGLCHQHLTLHAAVLERGGRALIVPAPSGSGKSTLCAGLVFRGWRLLSDELALLCPREGNLLPMPRPVSLKNESIEVIRRFAPEVQFGSVVHDTAKGTVAHFRPPRDAVRLARRRAEPGWIVFPRYVADAPARLAPLERAQALMRLIENAFNYDVFGARGFELLRSMLDRAESYTFEYGSLDEAAALFARLADAPPAAAG
jgi:HprK-related kinase A